MKDRNSIIGERVRYYRTAKKLSMGELAKLLPYKLTIQQISLYETGRSRWPGDLLCDISKILGVNIWLLTGMEDTARLNRKDTPEWEADKYKNILLSMRGRKREITYSIIDQINEL